MAWGMTSWRGLAHAMGLPLDPLGVSKGCTEISPLRHLHPGQHSSWHSRHVPIPDGIFWAHGSVTVSLKSIEKSEYNSAWIVFFFIPTVINDN